MYSKILKTEFTKSIFWLFAAMLVVSSFSIVILLFPYMNTMKNVTTNLNGSIKRLNALEITGRDIYMTEGCGVCHTLMIRHQTNEIARYGAPTLKEHDIYEFPQMWGSKRTGPDLYRIGGKYSDEWHITHLINPRAVVPESNMPAYPWLFTPDAVLSGNDIQDKMRTLKTLGVPYTQEEISRARLLVRGNTKGQALLAYLQQLGLNTPTQSEIDAMNAKNL